MGTSCSCCSAQKKAASARGSNKPKSRAPPKASPKASSFDRLVVYSSDTPDKDDFVGCLKPTVLAVEYDFATATADSIIDLIKESRSLGKGSGFTSIALANHGPPVDDKVEGMGWKISNKVILDSPEDLDDRTHGVTRVMVALGDAVCENGRVDLFACSLLSHEDGMAALSAIEEVTQTNFAGSTDLTGNPKDGGDWIMESDNVDVADL